MKIKLEVMMADHLDALYAVKNNPAVLKNIPGEYPLDRTSFDEKNQQIIDAGPSLEQACFTIFVNGEIAGLTGHFIRDDGDEKEVGYFIAEKWWGKGIASKALQLNLDEMRNLGISGKVIAGHAAENIASGRVLQKAGFTADGENAFTMPDGSVVMDPKWVVLL